MAKSEIRGKTLVMSILVPQERLWVDDLPASANLG